MTDKLIIELDLQNYSAVMQQLGNVASVIGTLGGGGGRAGSGGGSGGGGGGRAPANFLTRLGQAIGSTRFSMGPNGLQIMPLISSLVKVFGPYGAIVTGAIAAGTALFEMAKHAAEAATAFAKIGFATGGNRVESAALAGIGNALGIDAGGMARGLNSSLTSGGMGVAAGAQLGVQGNFNPFHQDDARTLLKAAEGLRKLNDQGKRGEAIWAATQLHISELLPVMDLSNKQWELMRQDMQQTAALNTPEMTQNATDFMAALGRVGEAFKDLVVSVFGPMLPAFTDALNDMATWIRGFVSDMQIASNQLGAIGYTFKAYWDGLIGDQDKMAEDMKKASDLWNTPANLNPMKDQTQATKDNTEALKQATKQGTFGGGERARGAVPKGWMGASPQSQAALQAHALALGAFTL